jgi:hypothetical protein
MPLKEITSTLKDGENNPILFDYAYSIKGKEFNNVIQGIREKHPEDLNFLPLSAASAGGGIFQTNTTQRAIIIGLHFAAAVNPIVKIADATELLTIQLDEIVIDPLRQEVSAGAGITLGQLNDAVQDKLGQRYRVLGADLTSYSYAQVGATFMTGGMGPQRRYFSDSIIEVALYDGEKTRSIVGSKLIGYAGTYGWTGLVTAIKCKFHQLPENELAFALPVSNSPEQLAKLLSRFSPYCFLNSEDKKLTTTVGATNILLGLEHLTVASMDPLFASNQSNNILDRAKQLTEKCQKSKSEGILFVSGFSDLETDEFLLGLVDDVDAESLTICDTDLEYAEVFNNPEEMRELREAIPYAARTQEPTGAFSYKSHTDANIRLDPDNIEASMSELWQINMQYVNAVQNLNDDNGEIKAEILIYGHMNPFGVDPHNRVTLASNDESSFIQAKQAIEELRAKYYRQLKSLCDRTHCQYIGGEKGADSEHKMYDAFGGAHNAPDLMKQKFGLQSSAVKNASKSFNWRALEPYR